MVNCSPFCYKEAEIWGGGGNPPPPSQKLTWANIWVNLQSNSALFETEYTGLVALLIFMIKDLTRSCEQGYLIIIYLLFRKDEIYPPQSVPLPDIPHDSQATFEVGDRHHN